MEKFSIDKVILSSIETGDRVDVFGANGIKLSIVVHGYNDGWIYYFDAQARKQMCINTANVFTIVRRIGDE